MTSCGFCGRENDSESRFCIDCGKAMNPSAMRGGSAYIGGAPSASSVCLKCGKPVAAGLAFCGHCGTRVAGHAEPNSCGQCGATYTNGIDVFCARCGHRVGQRVSIEVGVVGEEADDGAATRAFAGPLSTATAPKLALLGDGGEVKQTYTLDRDEAVVGRTDADLQFESDFFMSPLHARIERRDGRLSVRDLGSRNGTWVFIEEATKLTDCDLILMGSQLIRFRRLGYPGPRPPDADATRRMGSAVPTVDVAVLEQLRADGSVRDVFHLSPGRPTTIGRETGDWIFPYDATMSSSHAEVRTEDSEFFVHDARSRNGVAMAARGERPLSVGQRILIGDQILRVERI